MRSPDHRDSPHARRPLRHAGITTLVLFAIVGCDAADLADPFGGNEGRAALGAARPPRSSGLDGAALIIGDFSFSPDDAVRRYDAAGTFVDDMVPDRTGGLNGPCCIVFGPDQHLYASSPIDESFTDGRIQRFHGLTGEYIDDFVPTGSGLLLPLAMVFHEGHLYVGDVVRSAILRFDAGTGAFVDVFIPDGSQGMGIGDPQHFVFGPDGNLYVGAEFSDRILRYDGTTGAFIDEFLPESAGFPAPGGITFGPDGKLYAASFTTSEIRRFDIDTGAGEIFVPAGSGGLNGPVGIAFGPDGDLYATSLNVPAILRYDGRSGDFVETFVATGEGGLSGPRTLAWRAEATMCHRPPGNPASGRTITIGYLSGLDHMAHGDVMGACA